MAYQTVGSLHLDFKGIGTCDDYMRELDLENAVSKVSFVSDGVTYTRESFTSFTDQLLIIRMTASQKGKISFDASFSSPYPDAGRSVDNGCVLRLDGKGDEHETIEGKVRFTSLVKVENKGGSLDSVSDTLVAVRNADAVTLYVSIGTNYVDYNDISGDNEKRHIRILTISTRSMTRHAESMSDITGICLTVFPCISARRPRLQRRPMSGLLNLQHPTILSLWKLISSSEGIC